MYHMPVGFFRWDSGPNKAGASLESRGGGYQGD